MHDVGVEKRENEVCCPCHWYNTYSFVLLHVYTHCNESNECRNECDRLAIPTQENANDSNIAHGKATSHDNTILILPTLP